MSRYKFNLLIIFIFTALISICFFYTYKFGNVTNQKLNWDEVDYVNAAEKGFTYNILEKNTLSLREYIKLAVLKTKNDKKLISNYSKILPEEKNDIFYLRHAHSVLPVLYWSFFLDTNIDWQDKKLKYSNIILVSLIFFILILFSSNFLNTNSYKLLLISLISFLFLSSIFFFESFSILQFHTFYCLFLIMYFRSLFSYLENKTKINFIIFTTCSTLLIMTMETFVITFFSVFLSLLLTGIYKKLRIKEYVFYFLIICLTLLIFWPGIYISGSPIKSMFLYFYRIFFNANLEYNDINFIKLWYNFITDNFYIPILFVFILFFIYQFKQYILNKVFILLFHTFFYGIFMTPFLLMDRYLLPITVSLLYAFNLIIINLPKNNSVNRIIKYSVVLLVILSGPLVLYQSNNFIKVSKENTLWNKSINEMVKIIENKNIINQNILIDGAHIFKYYSKHKNIENLTIEINNKKQNLMLRANRLYEKIDSQLKNKYFKLIAIEKRKNTSKYNNLLIKNNYIYKEVEKYDVYILSNFL